MDDEMARYASSYSYWKFNATDFVNEETQIHRIKREKKKKKKNKKIRLIKFEWRGGDILE